MSYRAYQIWKLVMIMIVVGLTILAIDRGIAWIPIPAIMIGVIIMLITRRMVKEVVVDERSYTIANQASRITIQAGAIIMVSVGVTLGVLAQSDYPNLQPYADTLVFSAIGFLILYIISILYYTGKHGGAEEL